MIACSLRFNRAIFRLKSDVEATRRDPSRPLLLRRSYGPLPTGLHVCCIAVKDNFRNATPSLRLLFSLEGKVHSLILFIIFDKVFFSNDGSVIRVFLFCAVWISGPILEYKIWRSKTLKKWAGLLMQALVNHECII